MILIRLADGWLDPLLTQGECASRLFKMHPNNEQTIISKTVHNL